jgi:hypothetical protein
LENILKAIDTIVLENGKQENVKNIQKDAQKETKNPLKQSNTIEWLKKRAQGKAKQSYLFTPS